MKLKVGKLFLIYLVVTGVVAHFAAVATVLYVLKTSDLTVRQLIVKVAEKAGYDTTSLAEVVSRGPLFPNHRMDGELKSSHPRILLPQLATWNGNSQPTLFAERYRLFAGTELTQYKPCGGSAMGTLLACWLTTGDTSSASALLSSALTYKTITPDEQTEYGETWMLALAYDFLSLRPELESEQREQIEHKLVHSLREYLLVLDSSGPSLWHGRTTLASIAWLIAVTLTPDSNEKNELITRAQSHFLDVLNATEFVEAWPEGYNYWIQNRAFLFVLAANAYLNGLEKSQQSDRVRRVLKRVGLWTIYATRPDNRIEGYGDEGSRVDLKDETGRVIDLIASATRDPIFAQYARYLVSLHRIESYYSGYRWGWPLFFDPTIPSFPQKEKNLENFAALPRSEWFGKDSTNQFYIRSNWGDKGTFINYRAGNIFTHHQHYDAGHFSIFKGEPLAINSSVYGEYTGENRLNYSIRTIAKNSLLILRPGETVKPNHLFVENVSDGGQRVVMATGSAIESVAQWGENLGRGQHLEGGQIVGYQNRDGEFVYINSDLTRSYNNTKFDENGDGGKVKSVKRALVYLYNSDVLVTYDNVQASNASYLKKWLLHSIDKPIVRGEVIVAKGRENSGILETHSNQIELQRGNSHLYVHSLLPAVSTTRIVGGQDYQYYIESDADESKLNGRNYNLKAVEHPWFDVGQWRVELQPTQKNIDDEFLVVMSPRLGPSPAATSKVLASTNDAIAVSINEVVLVFAKSNEGRLEKFVTNSNAIDRIIVVGLPPSSKVDLASGIVRSSKTASDQGVFDAKISANDISIYWRPLGKSK